MRFKARIRAVATLEKVCSALASLNSIAWVKLTTDDVWLTVIPDRGSQCWTKLTIDAIFGSYVLQSASDKSTINLEIPLQSFVRALRSANGASDVWIRLTKKDSVPVLCLTISTTSFINNNSVVIAEKIVDEYGDFDVDMDLNDPNYGGEGRKEARQRQTLVTQDIPVKVLHPQDVGGLIEPHLREPDVNIYLPNLAQLKSVSDRFTRIAAANYLGGMTKNAIMLEIRANMHGSLEIGVKNDAIDVSSRWDSLMNPEVDLTQLPGDQGQLPSDKMKEVGGWAQVRVDARDFSKVLSVGRISSRIVACLIDDMALIMYCWLGGRDDEEESCLTYYIASMSL